jgi:dUTP pyrophosphatase
MATLPLIVPVVGEAPIQAKPGDACFDIRAARELWILHGNFTSVRTSLRVAIPNGWEGQVRGRSGMSSRGILVAFGTIDAGYRGWVLVNVMNLSGEDIVIRKGDRIAQLAIRQVHPVVFRQVDELDSTERGENGFGSTGR